MEALSISLLMDIILLLCLGVTVYYVLRLSRSLNAFKSHRQEFMKLMSDLSAHIEKAETAIHGMKSTSENSGNSLQTLIERSHLMVDELKQINEAGNNLATRLEGLAEKNSKIAQNQSDQTLSHQSAPRRTEEGFLIQDREFDELNDEGSGNDWSMDEAGVSEELQSQAERELLEALRKNRNAG